MTVLSPALTDERPEDRACYIATVAADFMLHGWPEAVVCAALAEWGLNERTLFIAAARGDLSAQGLPAHMVAPLSKLSQSPGPNIIPLDKGDAWRTPLECSTCLNGKNPSVCMPCKRNPTHGKPEGADNFKSPGTKDANSPSVDSPVTDTPPATGPHPGPEAPKDLGQSLTVAEACEALGNNLDLVGPRFEAWRAMDRPRRVALAGGWGYWPSKTDYAKPDGSPEWSSLYKVRKAILERMSPSERYWLVTGVK